MAGEQLLYFPEANAQHEDGTMQMDAKIELARALRDTFQLREASFIQSDRRYAKSYWQVAEEVVDDPDLRDIIPTMLAWSREHADWAIRFLEQHKAD